MRREMYRSRVWNYLWSLLGEEKDCNVAVSCSQKNSLVSLSWLLWSRRWGSLGLRVCWCIACLRLCVCGSMASLRLTIIRGVIWRSLSSVGSVIWLRMCLRGALGVVRIRPRLAVFAEKFLKLIHFERRWFYLQSICDELYHNQI